MSDSKFKPNWIFETDSYKYSHNRQYAPDTKKVYSYLESRGSDISDKTVFFGLSPILQDLSGPKFSKDDIVEACTVLRKHLGNYIFPYWSFVDMYKKYKGALPVKICAAPEGSVIDNHNVLMTVENEDPELPWLTNFIETRLLQVWGPTTIATYCYEIRKIIQRYVLETGGNLSFVKFMLHDFGVRGCYSMEEARIGGSAHLAVFNGTDNTSAMQFLNHYYGQYIGNSVPAMEHSTVMSWGPDREEEAYRNMLQRFPEGIVSCVSDTYDLMNCVENIWLGSMLETVKNRRGKVVIRLDSGDPVSNVLAVLDRFKFKGLMTENQKGYYVLPEYFGLLQGDGIDKDMVEKILDEMKNAGYCATNIVFGCGGKLLQDHTRDDFNFAVKASYTENKFGNLEISKKTAQKMKESKKGKLALIKDENGTYRTVKLDGNKEFNHLRTVFSMGYHIDPENIIDVRNRIDQSLEAE